MSDTDLKGRESYRRAVKALRGAGSSDDTTEALASTNEAIQELRRQRAETIRWTISLRDQLDASNVRTQAIIDRQLEWRRADRDRMSRVDLKQRLAWTRAELDRAMGSAGTSAPAVTFYLDSIADLERRLEEKRSVVDYAPPAV